MNFDIIISELVIVWAHALGFLNTVPLWPDGGRGGLAQNANLKCEFGKYIFKYLKTF